MFLPDPNREERRMTPPLTPTVIEQLTGFTVPSLADLEKVDNPVVAGAVDRVLADDALDENRRGGGHFASYV
jgi:hypothetical protein